MRKDLAGLVNSKEASEMSPAREWEDGKSRALEAGKDMVIKTS